MVKIIDGKEKEKKLEELLRKDELLNIVKKNLELPVFKYQIVGGGYTSDSTGFGIFELGSCNQILFFYLSENKRSIDVKDKKLKDVALKIAEEYEKLVGKEVEVTLDYR